MTEGDKMEKLRRISIVTFLIMIIVFGTIVGMLFYASDKTEKIYQQALKDMNSGNWDSSVELIQEVPHYKEASELYIYMYANKFLIYVSPLCKFSYVDYHFYKNWIKTIDLIQKIN
jgi:hypothetical protein